MKGFEQYADFPEKLNALGLEAVKAKGTKDFPLSFVNLCNYFKDGFLFYLLKRYKVTEETYKRFLEKSADAETSGSATKISKAVDNAEMVYLAWMKNDENGKALFCKRLENKIENYDADKNSEAENSFFWFVVSDLKYEEKRIINNSKADDARSGLKLTEREQRLMSEYWGYFEKMEDEPKNEELREFLDDMRNAGKKNKVTEKDFFHAYQIYRQSKLEYLDRPINEENKDDGSLMDLVPGDEDIKKYLSDDRDALLILLEKINDVCRKSFSENNKLCFSWGLTNRLIINDIKLMHYGTIQKTIDDRWNDFGVEEQKENYADGRYLCVSRELIEWFEAVRKELFDKDIAEHLGMKAPFFCKHFKQANDAVISHLNKLYKNS